MPDTWDMVMFPMDTWPYILDQKSTNFSKIANSYITSILDTQHGNMDTAELYPQQFQNTATILKS